MCFLSILFVYYTCNTGGFVQAYFGPTLLITLLIAFFSFLYVIIILGLPDKKTQTNTGTGTNSSNFSKFSIYGSIGFVIYLIVSVIGFMYLNGDLNKTPPNSNSIPKTITNAKTKADSSKMNNTNYQTNGTYLDLSFLKIGGEAHNIEIPLLTASATNYIESFDNNTSLTTTDSNTSLDKQGSITLAIVFILITTLIFGTTLLLNIFPESVEYFQTNRVSNLDEVSLFKRSLLILIGLVISSLLIVWIVYYIQSFSSTSGVVSFILNVLLVLIILILLYKTFNVNLPSKEANGKKTAIFNLIINLILYIPCLLSGFFDSIVAIATGKEYSTTTSSILLIIIAIILFILYIKLPSLEEKIAVQGGQLIINRPVQISNVSPLATYTELNGSSDFNYDYGMSFWFFIDAMAPNTNQSYANYTSILNYGNKPNISYNPSENTLRVTMEKIDRTITPTTKGGSKTEYNDSYTQEIVYEKKDILLQKWNNIIINYSGGTLDIFLNNELMKSVNGIVPYMRNDPLTVGSVNGLYGGVCNMIYFKSPLTSPQMYYLYNTVKNKTPPIANNSTEEIIYIKSIISSSN